MLKRKKKKFDPIQHFNRKFYMLARPQNVLPTERSVNFQTAATRLVAVGSERVKNVNKRNLWISHVHRIRDDADKAAFAELYAHFAPRVKGFLINSGADGSIAEECAQEVMVTLWRKAHLFDPSRASVATWIFTIARNRKIDILRKQRRPEPEDLTWGPEEEPDQTDVLALQQETEILSKALTILPAAQRELIEQAYFGDLSHSEIAKKTGLPLGTINSRIRSALERLRQTMN
jgi:RNA polymerase sigma-70 factor (ECF subfamily)